MTNTNISPYRKTYNIDIIEKLTENGNTYAKLAHYPAFMGNLNVESDEFKINGKEPITLKNNSEYYLVEKDLNYVEITLNWKKRLGIMQQNLGNALFRHFINESTDFEIINYKVHERSSYIDIKAKDLRFVTMNNLEEMTNYAILSNLKVSYFDKGINIDGLGKIYYEGPVLARTGETALVIIRNVSKREDYLRISVISGEQAFKYARDAINNLNNIRMYLGSKSLDAVYSDVKKLKGNISLDNKESQNIQDKPVKTKNYENIAKSNMEIGTNSDIKNSNKTNNKNNDKKLDLKTAAVPKDNNLTSSKKDIIETKNSENIDEDTNNNFNKNDDNNKLKANEKEISANSEQSKNLDNAVSMFKNYATEVNNINYIYKVLRDVNLTELKEVSTRLLKEDNFIQIYGIMGSKKSKIMIFRSHNLNFNLKEVYEKLKTKYDIMGSGNMFTLNIDCESRDVVELMETFLIEIRRAIK